MEQDSRGYQTCDSDRCAESLLPAILSKDHDPVANFRPATRHDILCGANFQLLAPVEDLSVISDG